MLLCPDLLPPLRRGQKQLAGGVAFCRLLTSISSLVRIWPMNERTRNLIWGTNKISVLVCKFSPREGGFGAEN